MHELMVPLQELKAEDVQQSMSGSAEPLAAPSAPAAAVMEWRKEPDDTQDVAAPTTETFAAMRWASRLQNDVAVLSLIRSLPKEVVEEQVRAYEKGAETAVAQKS